MYSKLILNYINSTLDQTVKFCKNFQNKRDQTSNRYDSILLWLRMENGLMITHSLPYRLPYPKSRDAIASKNWDLLYPEYPASQTVTQQECAF